MTSYCSGELFSCCMCITVNVITEVTAMEIFEASVGPCHCHSSIRIIFAIKSLAARSVSRSRLHVEALTPQVYVHPLEQVDLSGSFWEAETFGHCKETCSNPEWKSSGFGQCQASGQWEQCGFFRNDFCNCRKTVASNLCQRCSQVSHEVKGLTFQTSLSLFSRALT